MTYGMIMAVEVAKKDAGRLLKFVKLWIGRKKKKPKVVDFQLFQSG